MKKGFFWLFYLLFLTFFDIVLAVIRLNNSIYEFFINLNIKNEWILENLFSLEEIIFIIISLIFAYVGSLDVIFLIGLGVNLLIRRKNGRKKLDS